MCAGLCPSICWYSMCLYLRRDGQAELTWVAWLHTKTIYSQMVTHFSTYQTQQRATNESLLDQVTNRFKTPMQHWCAVYTLCILNVNKTDVVVCFFKNLSISQVDFDLQLLCQKFQTKLTCFCWLNYRYLFWGALFYWDTMVVVIAVEATVGIHGGP